MTHPFHPLAGKRLEILQQRRSKGAGLVFLCDAGTLGCFSLPASFTDRGHSPAQRPLTLEVLAGLVALLKGMRANLDNQEEETKLV